MLLLPEAAAAESSLAATKATWQGKATPWAMAGRDSLTLPLLRIAMAEHLV